MPKVFIVEDDEMLHELYRDLLASRGYEIVGEAVDGMECLEKLGSPGTATDVVIMDHRMPRMSGLEASRELLRLRPELRILFVSADAGVREEALWEGAVGFLQKPFDLKAFYAAIDATVAAPLPASVPPEPVSAPGSYHAVGADDRSPEKRSRLPRTSITPAVNTSQCTPSGLSWRWWKPGAS